jgi:IclR family transcriptional regulator, KDG regulon repressor
MTERDSSIRAVERALDVLDRFAPGRLELSLTEIAKGIDLAMSTTSRLVATLEKRGYLSRNAANQKFRLGARISQIGALGFSSLDLREAALPVMRALNLLFDEDVSLYVAQGEERVCVERIESAQPLRRVGKVGDRYRLTRGAAGRVLLAYLPAEKRAALLREDPATTEEALEELRGRGFTVSAGEREQGVTSIASPICDARREVVAALAMSGPSVRFTEADIPERAARVKEHAERVSEALGARRP